MNASDKIIEFIKDVLEQEEGIAQIKRNELAEHIGCVPSQVNYVITKWFTKEQGFIVESRRGGNGYIKIIKVNMTKKNMLFHIINSVGDYLDFVSARIMIENLYYDNFLTINQVRLMLAAIDDNNFKEVPELIRQFIRANIFKSMLIQMI